MIQQMYSIKETTQELGVEAHVLRYWEEELGLSISRNAQGRRVYSDKDLDIFRRIKDWKEQGIQLREIRTLIEKEKAEHISGVNNPERRIIMYRPKEYLQEEVQVNREEQLAPEVLYTEKMEKAKRLQELLKQFISESVRESNEELFQVIKEGLLKELDYQFRLQEERENERERVRSEKENAHFRELDENLRSAMEKRGRRKRKQIFSR